MDCGKYLQIEDFHEKYLLVLIAGSKAILR